MNWFKKVKQADLLNDKKTNVAAEGADNLSDENKEFNDCFSNKKNKLKFAQPIKNAHQVVSCIASEAPLTTEQWEMITNECSFIDDNKNLHHYDLNEIEALRSFVPKDKKQEAQQVFCIAQFAKEHELSGLFCLNNNIYGHAQRVKINKETDTLKIIKDLETALVDNDKKESVQKGMLFPKSLIEHPSLKNLNTHSLGVGNETNGNFVIEANLGQRCETNDENTIVAHGLVNICPIAESASTVNGIGALSFENIESKGALAMQSVMQPISLDVDMKPTAVPVGGDEVPTRIYNDFDRNRSAPVGVECEINFDNMNFDNSVVISPRDKVLAMPLGTANISNLPSVVGGSAQEVAQFSSDTEAKDKFEQIVYKSMCPGGMLINIKISKKLSAPNLNPDI